MIGFDIIFAEPDENSGIQFIRQMEQKMKHFRVENEGVRAFIEEVQGQRGQ